MTVILNLSNSQKVARYTGIAAGTLVVLFITFEAPLSGMSMNPARSFASDFVGMQWLGIWIYFAAPLIGMFSAAELFVRTRGLHSVICAKLNHSGNARCIFRCGYIWMDAKIGDWVVTPRYGKPVEIQALWFNALRTMESFAAAFRDTDRQRLYASLAQRSERSFNLQFWNEASGCLFDVVGPDGPDPSMRPNQIFAVSLYYSILDSVRAEQVVAAVQRELLTPYGLRTLAPGDPRYARQYQGDLRARDSSYHQGTVWPWLLGPFLEAFLRVHDHCDQALVQAREWMEPLHLRMSEYGLGQGE